MQLLRFVQIVCRTQEDEENFDVSAIPEMSK